MYPEFTNGSPPTISLLEYDDAPWAATTCIDFRRNLYAVVVMENPDQEVAFIDKADYEVLNKIFRSAHATHAKQSK
jgi:hypothetical protein